MAEKDILKVNTEETGQENSAKDDYRIRFVRVFIEILAGNIALIVPVILLLLWIYRVGICGFYGLPVFYSSLNVIRFLPVFIIFAIVIYVGCLKEYSIFSIFSVKINFASQINEKKEKLISEHMYRLTRRFHVLWVLIRMILSMISFAVLAAEIIVIRNEKYPFYFKNSNEFEAFFVLVCAVVGIINFLTILYEAINKNKEWDKYKEDYDYYASRRFKNLILRMSVPFSPISSKGLIKTCAFGLIAGFFTIILYTAQLTSYLKTSYYLLNFDDTRYAIVLDTDDYYICEPIEITHLEDDRTLLIDTDAYIYLDKAENPVLVQKESFDSVKILRE